MQNSTGHHFPREHLTAHPLQRSQGTGFAPLQTYLSPSCSPAEVSAYLSETITGALCYVTAHSAFETGYHKRLFENALKYHSGEPVSGILLLYSSCALHVIEVSHPKPFGDGGAPLGFPQTGFRDAASHEGMGTSCCTHREIKVLVVSHNIPSRLFPDWYVTTVTPSVTYLQDTTQAQSTEEVLTECLVLLFKLAAYDDSDDLNNDLHTLAPELIIPAETVNYLCDTEEFSSPEEFLKMYLNPLQPAMDSETVWPAPSHFLA
uniref:Uncharacterized protein n=1 Tax=Nothoprocta perdicaria TaxID=30464 RepID=A0A8C7EG76_NOTPE